MMDDFSKKHFFSMLLVVSRLLGIPPFAFINYVFVFFMFSIGNGGDAGHQTVNIRSLRGKMNLTTCRGVGGPVAANGEGGAGKGILFGVSGSFD